MTTEFDLDLYRRNQPPRHLWRVTHSGSQSRRDASTGDLVAMDHTRTFHNKAGFKQAIADHINWSSRHHSCFLSVFSDKRHAQNWAKQRARTHTSVVIHEIEVCRLPPETYLFDVISLMAELEITPCFPAHELLILHRITARSITSVEAHEDLQAQDDQGVVRQPDPYERWVSDLHGYYDTDDESEERNTIDDLVNMMEETAL